MWKPFALHLPLALSPGSVALLLLLESASEEAAQTHITYLAHGNSHTLIKLNSWNVGCPLEMLVVVLGCNSKATGKVRLTTDYTHIEMEIWRTTFSSNVLFHLFLKFLDTINYSKKELIFHEIVKILKIILSSSLSWFKLAKDSSIA